jgi:LmbE family N-acetylglucosaminyl deacetylase
MSKKLSRPGLLFVFAHPDDDAFGPAGSLILLKEKYDIYFLCATRGEAGTNHSKKQDAQIQDLREQEAIASSQVIGAKDIHFLDFLDGSLCNNTYHSLTKAIQGYVERYKPEVLMTFEPRGVSGHLDHIAVSLATHYVFKHTPEIKKLMLYCNSRRQTDTLLKQYFIYVPHGYEAHEIDEVYDISSVWERKVEAIRCHKTQLKDAKNLLSHPRVMFMEDHFLIHTRETI